MANETNMAQKKIMIAIAAVIVVVGGLYLFSSGDKGQQTTAQVNVDAKTEYNKGVALAKEKKFKEALVMFEKAAEKKYLPAVHSAGVYLTYGREGVEKNVAKGISYLTKAADAGYANAAYTLGQIYTKPLDGIKKDFAKGVKYIQLAAEKGHGTAMYVLGIYYENGTGVEKDKNKAIEWYEKAVKTTQVQKIKEKAAARSKALRGE